MNQEHKQVLIKVLKPNVVVVTFFSALIFIWSIVELTPIYLGDWLYYCNFHLGNDKDFATCMSTYNVQINSAKINLAWSGVLMIVLPLIFWWGVKRGRARS